MGAVSRSVLVRRPADEVAKVATDPDVVLPIIGAFGRFEPIAENADGSQEWDLYIDVRTIYVGGRVLVGTPSESSLAWHSVRGTRHTARIDVIPAEEGALVTMSATVEFAGMLTGRLTWLMAKGIMSRHIEAGLEQLRHHIEYGI